MSYTDGADRLRHWKAIILDRTSGGELILQKLYPTIKFRDARTDHFRVREADKTPSAVAYRRDQLWYVVDYGGDGKWRNAIDQYALERGLDGGPFIEILKAIAGELLITLP